MKKVTIFFILCLFQTILFAQQKNNLVLKVGNKLKLNPCTENKNQFVGIELYSRADMYDKSTVDSLTGKGLTAAFFETKTLEGKRLPCSMGGRAYKIASVDTFIDKNVKHTVVLLYDYYPLNLLLVDYETAMLNQEIDVYSEEKPKKMVPKKVRKVKK
jgi:hypothetical protein